MNAAGTQTILLIDDHKDFREMLKMFIERHFNDISVKEAVSGEEGIKAVVREKPDVVLVDVHLPDISGLQVARQINRRLPECRIITMSMFKDHDQRAFITQEVSDFISKDEMTSRLIPLLHKFFKTADAKGGNL